jgi:hypothetical protein
LRRRAGRLDRDRNIGHEAILETKKVLFEVAPREKTNHGRRAKHAYETQEQRAECQFGWDLVKVDEEVLKDLEPEEMKKI